MISRQEQREADVRVEKAERKAECQARRQGAGKAAQVQPSGEPLRTVVLNTSLDIARQTRKAKRDARKGTLLTFYASNPDAGPTEAGRAIGVSRQTVYSYLAELESAGRIVRNDGSGIEVLEGR